MNKLNAAIADIHMPPRMARRPISPKGFPVPWFARWENGVPDFVNIHPSRTREAIERECCWLCGERLGTYKAFTIGPMCCVNRISAEPPEHFDCALYAVKACPFLKNPNAKRNTAAAIGTAEHTPGIMIQDNPGVIAIWITTNYKVMIVENGFLFRLGAPTEVHFFKEGRKATRAEVLDCMNSRIGILRNVAAKDDADNRDTSASKALDKLFAKALELVPQA